MTKKKKHNPETLYGFFKQGKYKQGVNCLKSHTANKPQNAIAPNGAFDSGRDVGRVSEATASEPKKPNEGKTQAVPILTKR